MVVRSAESVLSATVVSCRGLVWLEVVARGPIFQLDFCTLKLLSDRIFQEFFIFPCREKYHLTAGVFFFFRVCHHAFGSI